MSRRVGRITDIWWMPRDDYGNAVLSVRFVAEDNGKIYWGRIVLSPENKISWAPFMQAIGATLKDVLNVRHTTFESLGDWKPGQDLYLARVKKGRVREWFSEYSLLEPDRRQLGQ